MSGWWFGWNIFYIFPINIGLLIIPTDVHIFQRGGSGSASSPCWRWRKENWNVFFMFFFYCLQYIRSLHTSYIQIYIYIDRWNMRIRIPTIIYRHIVYIYIHTSHTYVCTYRHILPVGLQHVVWKLEADLPGPSLALNPCSVVRGLAAVKRWKKACGKSYLKWDNVVGTWWSTMDQFSVFVWYPISGPWQGVQLLWAWSNMLGLRAAAFPKQGLNYTNMEQIKRSMLENPPRSSTIPLFNIVQCPLFRFPSHITSYTWGELLALCFGVARWAPQRGES